MEIEAQKNSLAILLTLDARSSRDCMWGLQFPLEVEEQVILQSLVEVLEAFEVTKENC